MTYRNIRRQTSQAELDRRSWASPVQVIFTYELTGTGEHTSDWISFGTVFESKPFFAYGVELAEDETLAAGDYPLVNAGVSAWDVTEVEDERHTPYYLGAQVWFNTISTGSYHYLFRLSFEGVAVKNTEHFRNG